MDKVCFFCTTPFQIMTAIHLTMTMEKSSEVDLYIIDQFVHAVEIESKIHETGVFHDVILIKEDTIINKRHSSKIFIWSQIMVSYLCLERRTKKILQKNIETHYSRMYISSKAFVSRLAALYYAKHEEKTEIIYFDDGLGSYYNRKLLIPRSSDKFIRKIFFGKKASNADPKIILLYSPDLFYKANINNSGNIEVKEIPKWNSNPELKTISNKVFSYSEKDSIEEPIIIFDGLYTGDKRKKLDAFYERIADIAGVRNVIIKKHPRDKEPATTKLNYYNRSDLPFEIICQNSDMEGKLLIGVDTTAVVTPVLLLNEEPYVLVLNKVPDFSSSTVIHYDDFKELYYNPDRFHESLTLDDALRFVKHFCGSYRQKLKNQH